MSEDETFDYAVGGPVWLQLALVLFLFSYKIVKMIYLMVEKFSKTKLGKDVFCSFDSCCGLFSGSAELSEPEDEKEDSINMPDLSALVAELSSDSEDATGDVAKKKK